jgi:hypothetical protein
VPAAPVERPSRVLRAEVEQELRGDDEDRVPGEDRLTKRCAIFRRLIAAQEAGHFFAPIR